LLNFYKFESSEPGIYTNLKIDPSPLLIAEVLNKREYILINNFNLGNYLIIVVIILLLISLLLYLYVKISIIEKNTEVFDTDLEMNPVSILARPDSMDQVSTITDSDLTLISSTKTTSQNTNITQRRNIRGIYLRHAIKCGLATISCLIFYQIFFYNYGLSFKYIGSTNELIVLFMETVIPE
jgi:hypothetical protein